MSSEIAYLARALKAPSLAGAVERLAERARAGSWTHEEFRCWPARALLLLTRLTSTSLNLYPLYDALTAHYATAGLRTVGHMRPS